MTGFAEDVDVPGGAEPSPAFATRQGSSPSGWEGRLDNALDGDGFEGVEDPRLFVNQDELDSLLEVKNRSGIQSILSSALVSYERLPMLEVVFDRLVRLMTTSLRHFTSDNVEVSLDSMNPIRFGDYLNKIQLPAMLSVIKAEEWDNYGLITVDSAMIYSIVDVLLGGRRGTAAMRVEGRPYTTIERSLVERLVEVMLNDLSVAFEPLSPVTFRFDRLETNPRFATISRPSNAAVVARFRIEMEDRGGKIELLLPFATLEPVRELLLQMFMGEKFGRDSIWETHLAEELWQTEIELVAVMDEQPGRLRDVFNLKVGSQLMFAATPDSLIQMRCGDVPMYTGRMGRKGDRIAIQIEDRIERKQQRE